MSKHGMYEDEFPDDGEPREGRPKQKPSHRRHRHRPADHTGDRHARSRTPRGETMLTSEPGWDRSNWLFLLVLTNFISLAIGTHIGHRHWDGIQTWLEGTEHPSLNFSAPVEPIARP